MTIKKTILSTVAAGALAAMVTGCGSSSDSNPEDTTTGIQSSVKAVDGYIYNATVKAFYLNEDNTTLDSVTLTADKTTKNTDTLVSTVGGSSYALSAADEANASIKDRIRYFEISTTSSNDDGNVTFTPAAYIEADGVDGYDVNDTLLGTTVIYAPANSGIASPLTSLAVLANPAVFGAVATNGAIAADSVELNETVLAAIDANLSKIATNLGLGDLDLKTADPVELASTNATFKLVTALLKGANGTDAQTILDATPATTLAETLAIVVEATSNNANANTVATTLQAQAANGALTSTDILRINLEQSVSKGAIETLSAPTIAGKFPISGITANSLNTSLLNTTAGSKYDLANHNIDINMTLAGDTNVSNTSFSILVAYKTSKSSVEDDSNTSSSVVTEIPFDLNITDSHIETNGIDINSLVTFQVKSKDGSEIVTKTDINASRLGLVAGDINDNTTDILSINVGNIVNALKTAGDSNTSADLEAFTSSISNVQVMLKDSTGAIVGASDANTYLPLARATFSDIGTAAITGVEAYKLLSSTTLDSRAGDTLINTAPSFSTVLANGANADLNVSDTNASMADDVNLSGATVTVSEGAGSTEFNLEVNTTGNTGEQNDTVTISGLPSWASVETATLNIGTAGSTADFNITIDGNASITTETTATATIKVTDEFDITDSDNDANVSFFFNLAPVVGTYTTGYTTGTNSYDMNTSLDINVSLSTNLNGTNSCTLEDNATGDLTCTMTDGYAIITNSNDDTNESVEINVTVIDGYGKASDVRTLSVTNGQH